MTQIIASTDGLPIHPFRAEPRSEAGVPGSKSISNRALLLASLCADDVRIDNLLDSDDTQALREAFDRLGIHTATVCQGLVVSGCAGSPPGNRAVFDVRNAGTVARFLPAALSVRTEGEYHFDGFPAMRKRPMAGLLGSLETLGAGIECTGEDGHFPFTLRPRGWRGEHLSVDASRSSQILSGLLIAATRAPGPMRFELEGETVSRPFVRMTLRMIGDFGGSAEEEGGGFRVAPGLDGPEGGRYTVEPDATAASYFFALPLATGGRLEVKGFPQSSLQGDLEFLRVLERVGLEITRSGGSISSQARGVPKPPDSGLFLDADFNAFSDTFLTLAALAPLLPGAVRIRGIGHTRHQETDRIAAMSTELLKLGQEVEEEEDSLTIRPRPDRARSLSAERPVPVDTYDDHRVAMSFGILGCHDLHGDGRPWIAIRDPECSGKTFPNFFEELAHLRTLSESGPHV